MKQVTIWDRPEWSLNSYEKKYTQRCFRKEHEDLKKDSWIENGKHASKGKLKQTETMQVQGHQSKKYITK